MNFKTKLFTSMVILPSLLFSSVELNDNSCATPYNIPQLSNISDDVTYSDDYSNKHSKDIYLSFNTAVDGNFSMELLKDNDKKMKYQLFMGNSCSALTLVQEPNFAYTHNVNLQVVANQDYIIKIVKHSNGNSRYNIAYSFIANSEEVIHGHTLPPEPDPVLNNSTLLGVDSNDNGVRDDVERWIYHTYKDKHPIHVDIMMQGARGYKLVLEMPDRAKEIDENVTAYVHCAAYYQYCVDDPDINETRLVDEEEDLVSKYFEKMVYFNTPERMSAFKQYNHLLSGGIYTMPSCNESKAYCDFNTTKYEEQ